MFYKNIQEGTFIARPNRFIAHCLLNGEVIVAHVKNTGRGKEVFLPGAKVGLVYDPNPKRKTHYDLVSVLKKDTWFNIDSQLPNHLVFESLKNGLPLPGLKKLTMIKPETFFQEARFDFYLEDETGEKGFLEVKGMTHENKGLGAFPDAPSLRGLKHVDHLITAQNLGYHTFVFFLAQSSSMKKGTVNTEMQPAFAEKITEAKKAGTEILCYNCAVSPGTIFLKDKIFFDENLPFDSPV